MCPCCEGDRRLYGIDAALDPFTGNEDAVSAGAAAACTRDGQSGSAAMAGAISARSTLRLAVSALIPSREDEDWVSSEVSDEYER